MLPRSRMAYLWRDMRCGEKSVESPPVSSVQFCNLLLAIFTTILWILWYGLLAWCLLALIECVHLVVVMATRIRVRMADVALLMGGCSTLGRFYRW